MKSALIVIDVQNDFCPGGSLAVPGGNEIVPKVNSLMEKFDDVVLTQDWHPANHLSFASSHEGKNPFETTELSYGTQVLWPGHCVQGTPGADFVAGLNVTKPQLVIRKGFNRKVDSYSAFWENDKKTQTGLAAYLRERGIGDLYFCGLATDFCVAFSAIDAAKLRFKSTVLLDACRGINLNDSVAAAMENMKKAGVTIDYTVQT